MRTTRRTTRRALRKLIERRSTGGDAVTSPKRTAALALTTVAQRHLARGPDGFVRGVAWRGVAWRGVAWRGVMVSTHGPRSDGFFIPYRAPYGLTAFVVLQTPSQERQSSEKGNCKLAITG